MSANRWMEQLWNMSAFDGPALANTVTATSLIGAAGTGAPKYTLPTNYFDQTGKSLTVKAAGRISTLVTAPGTLTLDIRLGGTVVANGVAMALNIVAKVNVGWLLEYMLAVRALGSGTATTFMSQGTWTSEAVIGAPLPSAGGSGVHVLPISTAPAVGTGVDASAALQVDLFATWSVANAANSIQLHQMSLWGTN